VCQTVSNMPVSVMLMSAIDLNDDVNSVVYCMVSFCVN